MTSIRRPGSPMCSPASTISSSTGWTNFCRGTGPPRWSVVKWQHERDTIARLKISLDDAKPAVLRRVEVPFDIRLDRLHLTIQAAMGWTNSHLYEIRAGNVGWSTPDPDADWASDFIDARKARLGDIL